MVYGSYDGMWKGFIAGIERAAICVGQLFQCFDSLMNSVHDDAAFFNSLPSWLYVTGRTR